MHFKPSARSVFLQQALWRIAICGWSDHRLPNPLALDCECSFNSIGINDKCANSANILSQYGDGHLVVASDNIRYLLIREGHGRCHVRAHVRELQTDLHHTANGKAPFSPDPSPAAPYARTMLAGVMHFHKGRINKVVDCGLGAGSTGTWMAQRSGAAHVCSVDINPNIIHAAPFFGLPSVANHHLVLGDCLDYINKSKDGTIDVIIADAYTTQQQMPGNMKTKSYYPLVKSKLAQGGVMAIDFRHFINQDFEQMARAFGGRVHIGQSPGESNTIAVAINAQSRLREAFAMGATANSDIENWFEQASFQTKTLTDMLS